MANGHAPGRHRAPRARRPLRTIGLTAALLFAAAAAVGAALTDDPRLLRASALAGIAAAVIPGLMLATAQPSGVRVPELAGLQREIAQLRRDVTALAFAAPAAATSPAPTAEAAPPAPEPPVPTTIDLTKPRISIVS
jgi:hypothetical protein